MRALSELLRLNKQIRVCGFDDAPFKHARGSQVNVSGIICSDTRFEGMLWDEVEKDGNDITDTMIRMLKQSKFYDQVNVILTDGIAVGGFNIIDLPRLAQSLERPCIAVMRKVPDMVAIDEALQHFEDYGARKWTLLKAGEIFSTGPFHFQVNGCHADTAAAVLAQLTDTGHVPEALRLAHMVGAAVKTGQSSGRA
jgi:endonuclease V-like protein UPF0215 family